MIYVEIDPGLEPTLPAEVAERAARATLDLTGAGGADLTLVLTSDRHLHELNRDYLGIDAATDVLSFPADEPDPETGRRYLGDVVLSLPRAAEQAKARGHAFEAEAQLLIVHGVLHLLGHDHANAKDKKRMWDAQAEVLNLLGIPASIVHE